MTQFTRICSQEQRTRYKAEFQANYNEYRELHSLLHGVSQKFALLEEKLKREQQGSEEWKVREIIIIPTEVLKVVFLQILILLFVLLVLLSESEIKNL